MKKFAVVLLSVVIAIVLTGCSVLQADPSVSPASQTPVLIAPTETGTPGATPSASPIEQIAYFGKFMITKQAAYGVSTYGQADVDKMIGKTLSFSSDKAAIINDQPSASPVEINNPKYSESSLTIDSFQSAFNVPAEKLGFSSEDIAKIDVFDPSGAVSGCTLLMQSDKVVIVAGGVYFVLERIM